MQSLGDAGGRRALITPNPAAAGARVSVEFDGAATLRVVDLVGATRLERSAAEAGRVELDLAGLAPGLHFVVITMAGRARAERLIVVP